MNEQFHIIIAGDQRRPVSFQVSKNKFILSTTISLVVVCILFITGFVSTGFFSYNKILAKRMTSAKKEMEETRSINVDLEKKLAEIIEKNKGKTKELEIKNAQLIAEMEKEKNRRIAELEMQNLEQQMLFKEEQDLLISTAVSELNERTEFIENIISDIGVKVKRRSKTAQKNIGGPYVAAENAVYDDLLYRADHYLKTIQTMPLGKPVNSPVSSWYGKRRDPFNEKKAFHEGIDFRGRSGDPVVATADGKIIFAGNNGGFGKFIKIDHGNGYTTSFAHLKQYKVKKGDYITRGQVIGFVGNSGRSTGSHLHYEIAYRDRHVNPAKFMKVAKLSCNFDSSMEK